MNKINKIRQKILSISFRRFFKWFLPMAIVIVLLGGLAAGLGFRTQISEMISQHQEAERVLEYDDERSMEKGGVYEKDDHFVVDSGREGEAEEFPEQLPVKGASDGMQIALGIYGGVCLLLFAVYWFATAAWLYKKAVFSKMNGLLWLILGLLGNVFAAALLLLVRSFIRQQCMSCGSWQKTKRWFCTECGAEMNRSCTECGQLCGMNEKYCSRCGRLLKKAEDKKAD